MVPARGFARLADREYVIGEIYTLDQTDPSRSLASHRHYFAAVHEAWINLPQDEAERFASSEHLRKWALIRAGYRDERSIVCSSKAEALRIGSFVKPMDEHAIVAISETVVRVYTAKSQSARAMGKRVFQESKDAVLTQLAGLLGVEVSTLVSHGRGGERANNPSPCAVQ